MISTSEIREIKYGIKLDGLINGCLGLEVILLGYVLGYTPNLVLLCLVGHRAAS